MKKREMKIKEW